MSVCPNGHRPPWISYDANGWRRWCGRCGADLVEPRVMPERRRARSVLLVVAKTLLGIATAISLIVFTAGAAVLIVYLISLLGP